MSKVSDFIDPNTSYWDEDLVRQTLWPIDAQRVLAIPLPMHDTSDFIAWSYTKNGLFTVRSTYWEEWNNSMGGDCYIQMGWVEPMLILFGARYGSYLVHQR